MSGPWRIAAPLILAVVCAAMFRLPGMSGRPMHGDEAVHTVKFDELHTTGTYVYDPHDYHGPVMYYATLPVVRAAGAADFATSRAWMFRLVPAIFGIALVASLGAFARETGATAAGAAALLAALSPCLAYYSRYYIPEMLLAAFTLLALLAVWRFVHGGSLWWAGAAGVAGGLMLATKETAWLAIASAAIAVVAAHLLRSRRGVEAPSGKRPHSPEPQTSACAAASVNTGSGVLALRAVVATGIALLVAAACLTALFNRPEALIDAVRAVASYAQRAGGETHQHPWYYYLRMLLWVHDAPGPVWSEGAIVLLAILGAMGARARWTRSAEQAFGRFLTLYALLIVAVYSAIPYKTPWCLVQIMLPLVLLAGIGVSELMVRLRRPVLRVAAAVLLAIALGHLGRQSYAASFRYAADARNPYAYAHPLRDVERLHGYLAQLSAVHPLGRRMEVHVIAPDPWPLPWYLREFEGVGYWESAAEWRRWIADHTAPNAIASGDADSGARPRPHTSGIARPSVLIVIADQQEAILEAVGPSYAAAYYGLRRAETLVVLVEEALRRAFVERAGRAEGSVP